MMLSGKMPKTATASVQLLGITKAAVQSDSFISAASFLLAGGIVLRHRRARGRPGRLLGLTMAGFGLAPRGRRALERPAIPCAPPRPGGGAEGVGADHRQARGRHG